MKEKVFIVKTIGGLGNQMFQYALGKMLAHKHGVPFKLDITGFRTYEFHKFGLEPFAIERNYATDEEVAYFQKFKRRQGRRWFLYNKLFANEQKYIQEKYYPFTPEILELDPPCYLDGYWQTEKYFLPIKEQIISDFTLTIPLSEYSQDMLAQIKTVKNPTSLHVRRGDFVFYPQANKHHGICPPEYYEAAITTCNAQIEDPHYFVFSDDPEWAREHIKTGKPTTFIGQGPDRNYEDLELMRNCKHHILSNSTFGWWGAWLAEALPGKGLTLTPSKWYEKKMDIRDLVPERWTKLPY